MSPDVADVESLQIIEAESRLLGAAKELLAAATDLSMLTKSSHAFLINPRHFDRVAEMVVDARRNLLIAKLELQERNLI